MISLICWYFTDVCSDFGEILCLHELLVLQFSHNIQKSKTLFFKKKLRDVYSCLHVMSLMIIPLLDWHIWKFNFQLGHLVCDVAQKRLEVPFKNFWKTRWVYLCGKLFVCSSFSSLQAPIFLTCEFWHA